MSSELVTADRLRPGDTLITTEGPLALQDIERESNRVRLCSRYERSIFGVAQRWWSVPLTTTFRRLLRSRRIEMRPDLHPEGR